MHFLKIQDKFKELYEKEKKMELEKKLLKH